MPRKMASATLALGMVQIPFGIAKASTNDNPDLKSLCECGSTLGYMADEDGNKIQCSDDGCDHAYPWWNSAPGKGFELGDDLVPLTSDEIEAARENTPVETGQVEKVAPVKRVLLRYAVEGNYYLLPEDEFEDQYGALVAALNDQDLALLTYLQFRTKTRRYAIVSEGGVLLALQLADKKALPSLEYGTDQAMEQQAASMLEGMVEDDPELEDVEGHGLRELVRGKIETDDPDDSPEDRIAAEV